MIGVEIIIPFVIVCPLKPSYWRNTNLKIDKINYEHTICSNIVSVLFPKKCFKYYHCEIQILRYTVEPR